MKILDKYILKTFVSTFTTVFVILFLIFILQSIWLFIGELAGKDLDVSLILKFLIFKMPSLVPLALPLSVLLASIMTFGDLSENYEFAAMKSSGISLKRALNSTTIFIIILSFGAFVFANNVIPYAEYKFVNFRKNIAQKKPALAIAQGQFSDIGFYSIKVDKKSGENGNILTGITIHEKSNTGEGNKKIIKAKVGELISNESSNLLKLVLHDGYYYEDITPKKYEDRLKLPFAKASFKTDVINMDLTKLNNVNINDESVTNTNNMLNIKELKYTLDSLDKNYKKDVVSFTENIYQRTGIVNNYNKTVSSNVKSKTKIENDLLSLYPNAEKSQILKTAINNVTSTIFSIDSSKTELEFKQKNINSHWIAFWEKFVIAYACLLMFFIGAPLGAIIRKGGLGLPIVFAILIFIIFHFINTFGKKVAQENGIPPFLGCWMSSIVLTPLAVLLTYRGTNDIGLINFDNVTAPIQKFFQKIFTSKKEGIQSKKSNFTFSKKHEKSIQTSSENKIEVTQKIIDFSIINNFKKEYNQSVKIALVTYSISIIFSILNIIYSSNIFLIIAILSILILYFYIFKSRKKIIGIEKESNKKIDLGLPITLLSGFPFFILLYFYNSIQLKKCCNKS